jgi:meso-butanediol dehydrogenase/(S,S)-butanediol dehydrogenase/diacetyl reductase/dihydroanticapsin dehydrogenase
VQDLSDEATLEREAERTLLSRVGTPRDVGEAVAFFASEAADWITGAELVVDGGYLAGGR